MKNRILKFYTAAIILLIISALLVAMASCSYGQIEDTNGDSTELCSIGEEDILKKTDSYNAVGSFTSNVNNSARFKAKKFSGIKSVADIKVNDGTQSLVIDASVLLNSGNLRVVLLHDGKIVSDIDISENSTLKVDNPSGIYTVKVAGESADFDVKITYQLN